METKELELAISHQQREITELKRRLKAVERQNEWMTLAKAAAASNGLFTRKQLLTFISDAIEHPLDSKLRQGDHYQIIERAGSDRKSYKVRWERFKSAIGAA